MVPLNEMSYPSLEVKQKPFRSPMQDSKQPDRCNKLHSASTGVLISP